MNTSVGLASLLLGLSLTLALPAGPAAAARDSDRSPATAHTQGRSASDPDGLSNGGADKPGHTGGFTSDRDGNNGCGNDDDREDDNNGWCGRFNVKATKPAKPAKPAEPEAAPAPVTVAAASAGTTVAATVLGAESAGTSDPLGPVPDPAPATPVSDPTPAPSDPSGVEVLGAQEERDGSTGPASLPRTGAGLLALGAAGAALAGAGATLRRIGRRG